MKNYIAPVVEEIQLATEDLMLTSSNSSLKNEDITGDAGIEFTW